MNNPPKIDKKSSSHSRQRKLSTHSRQSQGTKKIDVRQLESGLRIIITEQLFTQLQGLTGANAVEVIKEHMIKYFKQQEVYGKLKPVDIQIICEYILIVTYFVRTLVPSNQMKKLEMFGNILLDLFLYENPKYSKVSTELKTSQGDLMRLSYWLRNNQMNSKEMLDLVKWVEQDYFMHYQLFHFQATKDEGALDIVYNVCVDIPTIIPPLVEANFIPQQSQNATDYDSEEEDRYAFKRSYFQRKKEEENQVFSKETVIENDPQKEQEDLINSYIEVQIEQLQNEINSKMEQRNKQIEELIDDKPKKNTKK